MSRHTVYDAILGSLTLRQVRNGAVRGNKQVINGVTSAGVLSDILGARGDLRATFETDDVAAVAGVSNIATAGLAISSGTITIPWQKRANLSTYASGSAHYAISGTNGLLIPTEFGVNDMGPATCGLELVGTSTDGETAPFSEATAQALASAAYNALYGLGPVVINGTVLDRPAGFTVRPGISVRAEFARGKNFAEEAFIIPPLLPTIEIRCYDLETITGAVGPLLAGSSVVCYMRKRSGVGWVSDITAQHVKFSFADCVIDAAISGSGPGADGMKTYTIYGEALTVSGASAIT